MTEILLSTLVISFLKSTISIAIPSDMPGRCTLTATSSPVDRKTARKTCPSEAAATGCSEISLNISSTGFPSSSSINARATGVGNEGKRSCN